jgi:hypothetical protein
MRLDTICGFEDSVGTVRWSDVVAVQWKPTTNALLFPNLAAKLRALNLLSRSMSPLSKSKD